MSHHAHLFPQVLEWAEAFAAEAESAKAKRLMENEEVQEALQSVRLCLAECAPQS